MTSIDQPNSSALRPDTVAWLGCLDYSGSAMHLNLQGRRRRLTPPAVPLGVRFTARLPEIVRRVAGALAGEMPYDGNSGPQMSSADSAKFAEVYCRVLAHVVRDAEAPTESEVSDLVASATHGFGHGHSLPTILTACSVATGKCLEVLREMATSAELDQVVCATGYIQGCMQSLLPAVAREYLDEYSTYQEPRLARRAVFNALVNGLPVEEIAERARIVIAPRYTVVFLHVPGPVLETVQAQRRIDQIQRVVDEYAGQPVPVSLNGQGGTVLMPTTNDEEQLAPLVSAATGVPVTVGLSAATHPDDLPAAAIEATEIVTLARKLGRKPGVYRLADLLVEYQLTRPGRARDCLAAIIEPLTGHPHLLATLGAYIHHEHSRQLAAKFLHVHVNTLDYRLRRVSELTGLDPTQPSVSRTLAAALLAVEAR